MLVVRWVFVGLKFIGYGTIGQAIYVLAYDRSWRVDDGEWEVEATDQFNEWFTTLDNELADAVNVAIDKLAEVGPSLKRPLVGEILSSRHKNMKELRRSIKKHDFRVLFAFDPRRTVILLLGGDKSGNWVDWYDQEIPRADDLYDEYLEELRQEGLIS